MRLSDRLTQHEFIKHLRQILLRFPDKEIILFIDNYPSHNTPLVQEFLKNNLQIRIEWIPKYSPKLNIIEGIWKELKKVVGNWFYPTLEEMERAIRRFLRTLWYNKEKTISLIGFNKKYSI